MSPSETDNWLSQSADPHWALVERALLEQKRVVYVCTAIQLALLIGLYWR